MNQNMFYLIKRSPDFTPNGVIVKKNNKNKGYSENIINKKPLSARLKVGDRIFVSETSYGIYAHGMVNSVAPVLEFVNVHEVLDYYTSSASKDATYWLNMAVKLNKANHRKPSVLYYHSFEVDLKTYDRVRPLTGELSKLTKIQNSISRLDSELVDLIDKYDNDTIIELDSRIPGYLRLDLYSLFNNHCNLSTWIDVDHFVPKSIGGPGNIMENLVPVGFSLNRYKSDAIPKGLFLVAKRVDSLKSYVDNQYVSSSDTFIRSSHAKDAAKKIVDLVNSWPIGETRKFYLDVMHVHHPEYTSIIQSKFIDSDKKV